jgi:tight adherence protein C
VDVVFSALLACAALVFFAGVAIVVGTIATATLGRAGVSRGLSSIDRVYGATVTADDGGGSPVSNRMTRLGRVATISRALAHLRRRLDYAGNPPDWTVDRVFEIKGLGLVAVGMVGAPTGLVAGGWFGAVVGAAVGAVVGFFLPDVVIYDLSQRRQEKIARTLPDILDTLTVSVEAGLGLDAALAQVTRYGRGPIAGEFARVLQEVQIGRSRADALRALGQRTNVTELRAFCAIVVQAIELGVPIASVLREQAKEMRVRRRQRAEELAQKVPIKILFPLIFCLFPVIFIVVLGPGMINLLRVFGP